MELMSKHTSSLRMLGAAVALAVLVLSGSPTARGTSSTPDAPPAHECVGAACSSVSVEWEDDSQRFRVDNNSDSGVKVEVTTYAGASGVRVEPHKSGYLEVKYFNGPYRADFD
jgi:hypothetical protein